MRNTEREDRQIAARDRCNRLHEVEADQHAPLCAGGGAGGSASPDLDAEFARLEAEAAILRSQGDWWNH